MDKLQFIVIITVIIDCFKTASLHGCVYVEPVRKPEIMFYTNQTANPGDQSTVVVGLEGRNVSLRCFFSGRSAVHISDALGSVA